MFELTAADWSVYYPQIGQDLKLVAEDATYVVAIKPETDCDVYNETAAVNPLSATFTLATGEYPFGSLMVRDHDVAGVLRVGDRQASAGVHVTIDDLSNGFTAKLTSEHAVDGSVGIRREVAQQTRAALNQNFVPVAASTLTYSI
ncbi:hypothetical protein PI124_g17579 [Phytophthora idaei]|nr:hypothetical protein PI125_g23723 [Phytophthora idaei]KAG3138601.1 hypothetical protein PI126_g16835 [Phytophthora idaei]KAG3237428.1 hypothetical protein PI124_g17579 [Phytophthora idaei]